MKIDFGGRTWEVEIDDLGMEQALAITGYMGCSLSAWEKSLADTEDPAWLKAIRCLYWLMVSQDGEKVKIGETDFAVLKFSRAAAAAIEAETGSSGDAEPDPTKPAGEHAAEPPALSPAATGSTGSPAAT